MDDFSLAGDFPRAPEAEWLSLVGKALGGAPFSALQTALHEGFKTEPLYTQSPRGPLLSGTRGWHTIQPLTGNKSEYEGDITNGAGALSIDFGAGLAIETADKLKYFLTSGRPYYLAPGSSIADAALVFAAIPGARIPSDCGRGPCLESSAGFDPLTAMAISGEAPAERAAFLADYVDATFYIREHFPSFVPFLASGHAWDAAGGSAVQELAFTLSAGVSYWRALADAGMPLTESAQCIGFSLTASADIFLTIAKFRAMRLLWGRALEAAGVQPALDRLLLLARMPPRILSGHEPHVNLLRGTAAAFGAAIGGAAGIEILPFDGAAGGPASLSRRLARNTSLILQEESYLPAVADPAAGSAYVEALTGELAANAWKLFREVEAKGGLAAAIESGFVQGQLLLKAQTRQRALAHRKDKITGVSVFPNLPDKPAHPAYTAARTAGAGHPFGGELPALPAPAKGERLGALVAAARAGISLSGLRAASRRVRSIVAPPLDISARDAGPFEVLRRRADVALGVIGARPPIFLALLGKPSGYRARASFVQSFFAVGGIETIAPENGFESAEALAAAFKQSPAPAACLCASDAAYASVPGAASALKKAGAVAIYLAGPASILKTLDPQDAAAIGRLIDEDCNALALLQEAQLLLRVEELSAAAEQEAAEDGFEMHAPRLRPRIR
jgi:methylmalonyl-CoA mutase